MESIEIDHDPLNTTNRPNAATPTSDRFQILAPSQGRGFSFDIILEAMATG